MSFWLEMWEAFKHILAAPFKDLSVFWLLAPILILWIIMEVYFDMHKREELGWNTALGNGISMFWIGVSVMRHIFENQMTAFTWPRFSALVIILSYGLFITIISFKHTFKAKVVFLLASPSAIYYLSTIAILWGYGSLTLSWMVLLDLFLLFCIIVGIELLFRKFMPEAQNDGDDSFSGGKKDDFGSGEDFSSQPPTEQMPQQQEQYDFPG
ncbi:MAG: hypothetical protein ABIC95_03530 [archaeon]